MALENLKSIFSDIIIPDHDPEIGGIHGGTAAEPLHPPSHTEGMESAFGNIGANLSRHGGRHGGLSELTPSQPPHSEEHSLFDIGVGVYGSPQYAGVTSYRGIPFPSSYDPDIGGIHGLRSPLPPHSEEHSLFDIGIGTYGLPQIAKTSSGTGIPFPTNYDPNVGGIHGGLSGWTPSEPPHSGAHSLFDIGIGTYGLPQLREQRLASGTGILFPSNYNPDVGGIHGAKSPPPGTSHQMEHSAYDNGVGSRFSPQIAETSSGTGIPFPTNYDPNDGGVHGAKSSPPGTSHQTEHSLLDVGVGTYGSPQYAGIKTNSQIPFPPLYDPNVGGIHGGLSTVTPSEPPHSEEHSLFDIGVGVYGSPQYIGVTSYRGIPFPSLYDPNDGGIHIETHSLFDIGVGSFGTGRNVGGPAPAEKSGLYPSVTVASHQQSFTVTSPIGANTQVTGQIAFTRTPFPDAHLDSGGSGIDFPETVDFLKGGQSTAGSFNRFSPGGNYSYVGMSNYSLDISNTIPGFTKDFDFYGYSVDETPWGSSKFLKADGTVIKSGLASKSHDRTIEVEEGYGAGTVSSHVVDYLQGGYSYSGASNYGTIPTSLPNEIDGFTANFNKGGYTEADTVLGISKFLYSGMVKSSGLAAKSRTGKELVTSKWYTGVQTLTDSFTANFDPGDNPGGYTGANPYGDSEFVSTDSDLSGIGQMLSNYGVTSLTVTAAPEVLKLFSSDGIVRDYDSVSYDHRWQPEIVNLPGISSPSLYRGQIQNKNTYDGSNLDTKGELEPRLDVDSPYTITSVTPTVEYGTGVVSSYAVNFLTSAYTPFGGDTPITLSGFDVNSSDTKFVDSDTSTSIASKYLDSATEVPEGGGSGIKLEASSWWTGGNSAVKALVTPSKFNYTTRGLGTGITQLANTRSVKIDANDLPMTLFETKGWEALYNPDHTNRKDVDGYYYPNVRRDNLNPRYEGSGDSAHYTSRSYWDWSKEPYIVTDIGDKQIGITGRSFPIERALTDVVRLGKYLTSPSGLLFIGKQNLLGWVAGDAPPWSKALGVRLPTPQKFSQTYNPVSTIAAAGGRLIGQGVPNVLVRRDFPFKIFAGPVDKLHETYTDYLDGFPSLYSATKGKEEGYPLKSDISSTNNVNQYTTGIFGSSWIAGTGDWFTREPIAEEDDLSMEVEEFETESMGMPIYFKDLRDNKYIFFRGFIEGLSENVSPTWSEENYIGRSEPVYIYERATRDISFTLKLFAQTKDELAHIYQKINRLTSLCYPDYKKDVNLNNKVRMKPPLTKFRLGELFGSKNAEILGFIDSLSYTYDDNSPWETKQGKRVPKYILASITFKVIHQEVPSLDFARAENADGNENQYQFYGINRPPVSYLEEVSGEVGGVGVE